MERTYRAHKKCGQNQETNTEPYYKDARIPVHSAFPKETYATKLPILNTRTRTLIPHVVATKNCNRLAPKQEEKRPAHKLQQHHQQHQHHHQQQQHHQQQHPQQEQQQLRGQIKEQPKHPQDNYVPSPCLAYQCPSLSIELLSHVPSHLEKPYTPQSRRTYHLPPLSSKYEKERPKEFHGAEGDHLLYKNTKFDTESSVDRTEEHSERSDRTRLLATQSKNALNADYLENKVSSPLVKSAREHCKQMNARFKAKYTEKKDSDSGSLGEARKTLISDKSAGDLRSVVCSQIHVQDLIEKSVKKLEDAANKRKELISSLSELSINTLAQDLECKLSKLQKSQTKTTQPVGLMLSVSVEEMVSAKLIAPVVRKVQRMYLGTLKEEMSIIEDLERLPCQVSSVFQTADEQQKKHSK